MISLDLQTLASILGASGDGLPAAEFTGVAIDSRQSCAGRLFVALRGENFDGHGFLDAARQGGAVAALVESRQDCAIEQIEVDDCRRAMAQLANYWRRHCDPCVLALTGSNGKTTVKEMLYRVLSAQAPTLATRGNLNNDIGVPLTLFELGRDHEFAIVEMGANHRGEIARLAEIAEPDIVYVNNAAASHLEGFGDLQGVIEAKGELYAYCGPEQCAVFNLDEPASSHWRSICAAERQLTCALVQPAEVGARCTLAGDSLQIEFVYRQQTRSCKLGVLGEHNARNALAAVSMALMAGIDLSAAVDALHGFSGVGGRQQVLPGPAGSRIIDDSYNANPASLEAGIRVLCALDGAAWLALGDMAELGSEAEALHRQAAHSARDLGIERLFGIGEMSCIASREFGESGYCYERIEDMANAILAQIHPGVNLLIKGSRSAGMERLVALLSTARETGEANAV